MRKRYIFHNDAHRKIYSISILFFTLLCLLFLAACDSSETRNTTKSSTSSETELQIRIHSPTDGSTSAFTVKAGKESDGPTSEVSLLTGAPQGGTPPHGVTFTSDGPTTSNSSTGSQNPSTLEFTGEMVFRESGVHRITAICTDSRGLTASDSVSVTIAGADPVFSASILQPASGQSFNLSATTGTVNVDCLGDVSGTSFSDAQLVYSWSASGVATVTGTGPSTTLTFSTAGEYTLTLIVTDPEGERAIDSASITIAAAPTS